MREPVLVIMAAGMGSRFGGLKQITPVDDQGHSMIDYSLYDAWKAGFRKVVFIIKHEIEADFKKAVGSRMEKYFDVKYVFQQLDKLLVPLGFVELPLHIVVDLINLFQVLQIFILEILSVLRIILSRFHSRRFQNRPLPCSFWSMTVLLPDRKENISLPAISVTV